MRSIVMFTLGAAAGAAVAHFLDPDSGRKRRNHAKGMARAAASRGPRLEDPDDVTLARKVETQIFRPHDAPKGTISVDVQAGVAYLRGEAPQEWIDRLGEETRKVDGITGVKNLLHAPGTPTPAAEPRFLAAEHWHRN